MATQANTGLSRRRVTVRRGVVVALVLACLVLLTGYFREADDGPLHGAQDAVAGAFAPVQDGASAAVQPLRDAWGWASSLKDARDRADAMQAQNDELRAAAVQNQVDADRLRQLETVTGVGDELNGYEPLVGRVIERSISIWSRNVALSVGTADGVIRNSPVVVGAQSRTALVGYVTRASGHRAVVTLVTDSGTQVGAFIPEIARGDGLVSTTTPGELTLSDVSREAPVKPGQLVVTSGSTTPRYPSIYPRGLAVGQVTSVGGEATDTDLTVQVTPYVGDPRDLAFLTVLRPRGAEALRRARGA